jgi:hypothetical protein
MNPFRQFGIGRTVRLFVFGFEDTDWRRGERCTDEVRAGGTRRVETGWMEW